MSRETTRLIERLARQERQLVDRELLAPVVAGGRIGVRISGLVSRWRVIPSTYEGWAILRARGDGTAQVVREATLAERETYCRPLPRFRLVVAARAGRSVLGVPATADHRLQPDALYPISLAGGVQLFDVCLARFDGAQFWGDGLDPARDPVLTQALRSALAARLPGAGLDCKGLSARDRRVYDHALDVAIREGQSVTERALRRALGHGGASLDGFTQAGDELTVRFQVRGRRHVALVRTGDLAVVSAGICLSGQDSRFDLASLVGVLEEAMRRGNDGD